VARQPRAQDAADADREEQPAQRPGKVRVAAEEPAQEEVVTHGEVDPLVAAEQPVRGAVQAGDEHGHVGVAPV
jgi:hypothetical protein